MTVVGPAAAAHHIDLRVPALERCVLPAEFLWIPGIEHRRVVQFGVTLARSVRAKPADAS